MSKSPLQIALAELSRRDLSVAELHLLLARRGFLPHEAEEAFARLEAWNLISDERAALARLRRRTGRNARGDALLREELLELGIEEETVEAVLAAVFADQPETERAAALLSSKYPNGVERPRAARFLASRGFGEETVVFVVEALPGPDPLE